MQVICPCCGTVIDFDTGCDNQLVFNMTSEDVDEAAELGILFGEEVNENGKH